MIKTNYKGVLGLVEIVAISVVLGVVGLIVWRVLSTSETTPTETDKTQTTTEEVATTSTEQETVVHSSEEQPCDAKLPRYSVPEGWSKVSENEYSGINTRLDSSDYRLDTKDPYPTLAEGASIRINVNCTGGENIQSTDDLIDFYTEFGQICCDQTIEELTISGVKAVKYYWTYEGPAILITSLFDNGHEYSITLDFAQNNMLQYETHREFIDALEEKSKPFEDAYQQVLESIEI